MPELEHEERPELLSVISAAGHVLGDQALNRSRVEDPLRANSGGRELVLQRVPQLALEPFGDGDSEPLLCSVCDAGREEVSHRALEQMLRVETAKLQPRRHTAQKLHEIDVEERCP